MSDTPNAQHSFQQWEYRFFTKQTESYLLTELTDAGREGWEMVSCSYNKDLKGIWGWTAFLKRPLLHGVAAPRSGAADSHAPAKAQPQGSQGFDLSSGDFDFKAGE